MKLLLSLLVIFTITFGFTETSSTGTDFLGTDTVLENLEIVFNDEVLEQVELIQIEENSEAEQDSEEEVVENRLKFAFEQGYLLLNQEDYGTWDFSHILAVRVRQTDDTYSFDATVRHRDEGWEHYADMFRIVAADEESSVENGERVLLHPHDSEQPFTRSQSRVVAFGMVCIEARDTVHDKSGHEWGGSSLCLDLAKLDFSNGPLSISWTLEK